MKMNKENPIWKEAPVYVKLSALGSTRYESLETYATVCISIAYLGLVLAIFMVALGKLEFSLYSMCLLIMGLPAHSYAISQVWIQKHSELLSN